MKRQTVAAPPNSVVLVMDYVSGEPPESMGGRLVSVTDTCVAVGTMAEQSGETRLTLTDDPLNSELSGLTLVFDGKLRSTSGEVALVTALNQVLLSIPAPSKEMRVRVWVNDYTEPDRVAVVVE